MKKIFIILLVFISTFFFAQGQVIVADSLGGTCGTSPEGPVFRFSHNELVSSRYALNNVKYVFNVKVHYISNNVPVNQQELKALDLVGILNIYYNQAEIYFKYNSFDNIDNPSYLNIGTNNIGNIYATPSNRIDIYICDIVNNNTQVAGSTYLFPGPNNTIVKKTIALRKDYMPVFSNNNPSIVDLKYYTLVHEVGHYLGLYHTHQQWQNIAGVLSPINDTACGLEENYDNSQWATLGDLVQDTNPDRATVKYLPAGTGAYFTNCTLNTSAFIPNATCGTSINTALFNPPMSNIMAYYNLCRTGFSQGQYDFMRAFINANLNGNFLTNQLNDDGVDSLYQAFAISGVGGSQNVPVVSTALLRSYTPNATNTGANVWNCPQYIHRFQKGLTYEFSNLAIGTLTKLPFIQYNYLLGSNSLDVKIPALGTDVFQTAGIACFATFEPYISGDIKSLTNLGSNTIKYQTLDEIKASNPDLYNELESQEYHIITKETESGYTDQKIIYKN